MSEPEVAPVPLTSPAEERYSRSLRSVAVSFRGGKASAASVTTGDGQALRLIEGGRLGVAARSGAASPESDARLLERAREAAAAGDPPGFAFATPTADPASADPGTFSPEAAALGPKELEQRARAAVERLRAAAPDAVADVDLRATVRTQRLALSTGLQCEERASLVTASVSLSLPLDGDLVNAYGESAGRGPAGLVEGAERRALHWLELARRRVPCPAGAMRVVFAPEAVAALLDPWVQALEGLEAAMGTSPMADALGDRVLDPRLTLADDGRAVDGVASSRWDGEGVPRRRSELIVAGELVSFYHDLRSAARLGVASTGNAAREDLLPCCVPGNWLLESSETRPLAELLAEAGDALLVVELLGVGQTASRDGSFANPVALGFRVQGGEIVGRVTDVTVAGNAFDLLRERLVAAGDDLLWSHRLGFPMRAGSLLVDAVSVTAAG